ncbi:MAG: FHA domain-containing protein [Pseudomonadota bacterium]
MKLILEIRAQANDGHVSYRVVEKFPFTVGRGFCNDVILNDPHVSPQELRIECDSGCFFVHDLGSENGFIVNGMLQHGQRAPLRSGDTLCLGQTEVRVYAPEHPVSATIRLQKTNSVFLWLSRAPNVWASFLLALALALGWAYLEVWTEDIGLALAGAGAGTVGVIVLWSAIWSVAGRLTRHKAYFRSHAAMVCLYTIAGTLAWYVESYVDFLTNENWVALLTTYGINFILLAFLLYGSLTLATLMTERRRLVSAGFFAAGVMGGVFALSLISAKNFSQQPLYPSTLEPYLSRLAPADTVEEFMAGNGDLFSSEEFSGLRKKP